MIASDETDQNKNNEVNYEEQNKMLRELYEERMRARAKQNKDNDHTMQEELCNIVPTMKSSGALNQIEVQEQKTPINDFKSQHIFLNALFYDTRPSKPNFFIKFSSLLNQQVSKPKKYISQKVESIFITTFGFQTETFERLLTESKAKLVILNDSDIIGQNRVIKQYSGFKNLTVVLKAKQNMQQKYGVFHSKLWFIKFRNFLRVVICTSNQHTMDWTVWENAFWYQDFPLKSSQPPNSKNTQQNQPTQEQLEWDKDFYQTLLEVVTAMLPLQQLQQLTSIKLDNYLFNNIKIILIPSIPGRHVGQKMRRQGICKVKEIMKKYNKIKDPILTYQSTSLGTVDSKFIEEIYSSFNPHSHNFQIQKYRLIYPTKKYIEEETGGQASVLFLTTENLHKSDVGKKIFYKFDTNPQNPILGCIPHLKTILLQPGNNKEAEGDQKGILYMGSHNMTRAAWGKYQKQGSQLYITNSQLGMIFLDVDLKWFRSWSPFKHPPPPYSQKDLPFVRDYLK